MTRFNVVRRASDLIVPPDTTRALLAAACPDHYEPPPPTHSSSAALDYHPWTPHPVYRRKATGRWLVEIEEAHAEHVRSCAGSVVEDDERPDELTVPWVKPEEGL